MKKMKIQTMIFQLVLIILTAIRESENVAHEERTLHAQLLKDYNPAIRPVRKFKKAIPVYFDFVLEEVNSLDVKEQKLSVNAFVTLTWNDPQLAWNTTQYPDIDDFRSHGVRIWRGCRNRKQWKG